MTWACYEKRGIGSCKKSYGNVFLRKKRKKTEKEVVAIKSDMGIAGVPMWEIINNTINIK